MMDINVSVIVPVYNAASTLRKCVDSLLAQTLKD
ncbi:MAG TPA: glycosyl transferase family 2, partial [Prevotella sp.]|nr:glycosyl transferase family 2 [Prevotella sp.]